MKIRAAVLEEFDQPLHVQEVDLAEPAEVTDVAPGDHVVTLFSPQCRECLHCIDPRTNLCLAIRDQQNRGYLPDGTTRLSRDGEPIRHFMGYLDVRPVHGHAPDRAGQDRCRGAAGPRVPVRVRPVHRPGGGDVHRQGGARLDVRGLRRGNGRAGRGGRRAAARRRADHLRGSVRGSPPVGYRPGRDADPHRRRGQRRAILELTDDFGADYTFEATGKVEVMQQAVEAARMGWGLATICGVAGKGETLDIVPRLLITGRRVAGSSFGGVKGRDQVPQLVDRYMRGDIDVDAFLSHRITLDEVNKGFDLMHHQDGIRSVIDFT